MRALCLISIPVNHYLTLFELRAAEASRVSILTQSQQQTLYCHSPMFFQFFVGQR